MNKENSTEMRHGSGVLVFKHLKPFATSNGTVVIMKALLTVHGEQLVEVYENSTRYKANELTAIQPDGENEIPASND